tara:strand:- start:608 stop:976 length:369 start_codon:yes stop_codon:yes gene_type:complete
MSINKTNMFRFNSFTNELPNNTPPEINKNNNSTPIIHINNLTINVTPSEVVDCLKQIVQPQTYNKLPLNDHNKDDTWYDENNDKYYYDNCRASIFPNKRLTLDIKKSNKLSPLELYRKHKQY